MYPPKISDVTHMEGLIFRLACVNGTLRPKAAEAYDWIATNVPIKRIMYHDSPKYNGQNQNIMVKFYDEKDAALFKLFCL